jgi:prophage regulatory protein
MSEIRLITKAQVVQQLNISERKLENMVRARAFPPPLRIGKQAQWVDTVVHKWLEKTVEAQINWEAPKRRSKYS